MRLGASALIINTDKQILLLKRSNYTTSFPHCWTMPGGRGEEGETPQTIVVREVEEESGLSFSPTELYATHKMENSGETIFGHRFLGTYSGKVQIQEEEAEGYAWCNYDEAIRLNLAFDYKDIINKLHKDGLL